MNQHEAPIFGRKVFFIEPQQNIAQFVIPKLIEREYEVYIIDSYQKAKNYLRGNADAIVFCCVNPSMSVTGWFNFIKSFEEDEILSTMIMGIIAYRMQKSEREMLMLNCELPAGYLDILPTPDAMTEMIVNVLDLNGAMGRRKYIRADSGTDKATFISLKVDDKLYKFSVDNISSVGLAFRCSEEIAAKFPENTVIRDGLLSLSGSCIQCDSAVIMQKNDGKSPLVVILFMKGTSVQAKTALHNYVFKRIQYVMDLKYEYMALDDTDYELLAHEATEIQSNTGNNGSLETVVYADDLDAETLEELKSLGDDTVNN